MSSDAFGACVIISIVAAIVSTALVDRDVYPAEWNRATELCTGANSTLHRIEINSLSLEVYCENGAKFGTNAAGFSGKYQIEETKK